MTNFKALGIEKEIEQEFKEHNETDLSKLLASSYFDNPYITEKKKDAEYCTIEVMDCQDDSWWYKNLIGFEFFCRIEYKDYGRGKQIVNFKGVKLTKTKEIVFRDFDPKDVTII